MHDISLQPSGRWTNHFQIRFTDAELRNLCRKSVCGIPKESGARERIINLLRALKLLAAIRPHCVNIRGDNAQWSRFVAAYQSITGAADIGEVFVALRIAEDTGFIATHDEEGMWASPEDRQRATWAKATDKGLFLLWLKRGEVRASLGASMFSAVGEGDTTAVPGEAVAHSSRACDSLCQWIKTASGEPGANGYHLIIDGRATLDTKMMVIHGLYDDAKRAGADPTALDLIAHAVTFMLTAPDKARAVGLGHVHCDRVDELRRGADLLGLQLGENHETLTAVDGDKARLTSTELAKRFGLLHRLGALRKRLARWRKQNGKGWVENPDATSREAKYLYEVTTVRPVIDALKSSPARPANVRRKKIVTPKTA